MAEEEGGKVKAHTCPHPQQANGAEAGAEPTCTMVMAEGLVIEAEEVAGAVGNSAEGVRNLAEGVGNLAEVVEAEGH